MANRKRNYKKEYARRKKRGLQLGLSLSAARGHRKPRERTKRTKIPEIDPNSREERALKMMRKGTSLKEAAARYKLSQERLRTYLMENTEASYEKRSWKIVDHRLRQFPFYSEARLVTPWMYPTQASEAGRYSESVGRFLQTGNASFLKPYVGKGVRDDKGKFYPFEVDENTLYELDHRGEAVIPEQYRIGNRSAA